MVKIGNVRSAINLYQSRQKDPQQPLKECLLAHQLKTGMDFSMAIRLFKFNTTPSTSQKKYVTPVFDKNEVAELFQEVVLKDFQKGKYYDKVDELTLGDWLDLCNNLATGLLSSSLKERQEPQTYFKIIEDYFYHFPDKMPEIPKDRFDISQVPREFYVAANELKLSAEQQTTLIKRTVETADILGNEIIQLLTAVLEKAAGKQSSDDIYSLINAVIVECEKSVSNRGIKLRNAISLILNDL